MKPLALLLFLFSAIAVSPTAGATKSQSDLMNFELRPPDKLLKAVTGATEWEIYASGPIDTEAPSRLSALVKKNHIPFNSALYLSSPGGSLIAGMQLGRLIRSLRFTSQVGKYDPTVFAHTVAGQCFSACTLAYLGGTWRFMWPGSLYGVHRFYFSKPSGSDADSAQMMSAVVIQYIRDMGADPALFSEMTLSGKDEITIIPERELEHLNVVNNGQTPTDWSVVSAKGVVYLRGHRDTAYGVNKFLFGCTNDGVYLSVVLDPLAHGDPLPPTTAISFVMDDKQYPIEQAMVEKPEVQNGSVFVGFLLPPDIARALESAHEIGIEFQFMRGAPTFVGFLGMNFDDGAQKMTGVLRECLPN